MCEEVLQINASLLIVSICFIRTHEMKNGKYLYIMHISLSMPCEVLMNCSPVHYKYYVDAELSKKWEWLPRVGLFRGNYTHRGLNIPADVIRQTGNKILLISAFNILELII